MRKINKSFILSVLIISSVITLFVTGFAFKKQDTNINTFNTRTLQFKKPLTSPLALMLNTKPPKIQAQEVSKNDAIDKDWYSRALAEIENSEYYITYNERINSYQSPNRRNNLRFVYHNSGFSVSPRQTKIPLFDLNDKNIKEEDKTYKTIYDWKIEMSLSGYGRECEYNYTDFNGTDFITDKNTAFIEDDNMRINYINDKKGMRQDFILKNRPAGTDEEVTLNFKITSKLKADIQPHGIKFLDNNNASVMSYSSLYVTDANGKVLKANFKRLNIKEFAIVVNDKDAVYPVTIDPLSNSPNWTAESDQATANFGYSVSTAGDVNGDGYSDVIVGAPNYDNGQTDEGRVFVYHGSASGLSATANWTAESNKSIAYFGYSVSTAGDVNGDGYSDVIVGARYYDNGQSYEGMAFVYHGSASGLSATANWTAESNQSNAWFGSSVSTAGDVNGDGYSDVIVGAIFYDNGQLNEGGVFVYHGSSSGLSATANWTAESDQAEAYFGASVSTAGDVNGDGYSDVIVGSYGYDNGQSDEGRAFVYHGSASGLSVTANWTAESNQSNAYFGGSVSTAGDVNGDGYCDVIVGAPNYDSGQSDEGSAFVYHGSASGLSATANWTAESDQYYTYFGASVSTAGDVNGDGYSDVIVGAKYYKNGETDEGKAYVYHGSASGLSATANWSAESDQLGANFGCSVSTAGDVNGDGYSDVIVGAYRYDNGQTDEGWAFVYHGSASGLSATVSWTAESDQANANFGWSVSTAGDVNGDGYSDVIVGAISYDNGQTDEGRAFVYYGSASGLSASANWTAESNQTSAQFGSSVSTAGDVNGDGYSDVIVGALTYDNGQTNEGRAFVYHGSASGLSATANWTAESDKADAFFGYSVSTAGDVNGDGYSDVIVGAYRYSNGQLLEGRAFVYHGSASGLSGTANWTAESNQGSAYFGFSVSTAGDVNGDGYSDVIVGADFYDNGQTDEGRAFVYHGSVSGLSATANWMAEINQATAYFGYSVSTAGDVNGDGYSDVIVGAFKYDNGQTDEGSAFVYHGSASGLSATANWTAESNQVNAQFGWSVSTAGDVNGDGYSEVIVGAYTYDNGETDEGSAFVYHGSTSGLSAIANWTAESDQASAQFGHKVSTAGDVNGDGYSDVIVGAPNYDNVEIDEGRAIVYYGNGGTGMRATLQQYKPGTNNIIGSNGLSGTSEQVKLNLFGRSPFGRADGKLVYEIKGNGSPFSSGTTITNSTSSTGSGNITDLGTSLTGIQLNEEISGITTGFDYKWRVRVQYSMVNNPYQKFGPWKYYTAYSPIPFGCFKAQDIPLPVELLSFSSKVENNNVKLSWTTATEINNSGFEIQRMLQDGKNNWTVLGFVEGKGTTTTPSSYTFTDKNLLKGKYQYRLKQIDHNGNYEMIQLSGGVNIGNPARFELSQNYPNPFNPVTKINFALATDTRVTLKIYDMTGREIRTLINNEFRTANWYTAEFNGTELASGTYFYRIITAENNAVRKMMLIK